MKVALIPARGGSKRIPRKNIKLFHGKPLIAYSIKAALDAKCFDKVIVSTDDEEIAKVAREYGAEVPFMRPSEISDDHATTVDVIKHAIEWFENSGAEVNLVCCIYATAPFISAKKITQGLEKLEAGAFDYSFSATSFPFPVQRALSLNSNGSVKMLMPEHINTRSQDLEEAYHDAGQFYWGRKQAFMNDVPIFSNSACAVLLPRIQVQDIDTVEDWHTAEVLYQLVGQTES